MQALWKQAGDLHPTFAKINQCLREDWFLLPYELRLQRAHAKTLADAGLLLSDELSAVERGLDQIEQRYLGRACPESDAEDLHTWLEAGLTELAGAAGKKIHTARSRNDQIACLLTLYAIGAGEALSAQLSGLVEALCRRAKDWSDLVFPLQTHQQFAAPGTVGFWALRYAVAWQRARRHLDFLIADWRRFCPLGSAAVAGSSIPINRRMQARELGFDRPSMNALDSTTARDECLALLAWLTPVALHLQSFATDVIGFSQTALAWAVYPADFGTGSSMMPNKTNPDAMELLRGECNAVIAAHAHATLVMKGLPSGYNRDLQCIKPVLNRAVETAVGLCELVQAFLPRLEFDADRLAASLPLGNIDATFRMEQKVKHGAPLREAHHAVADELSEADQLSAECVAAMVEGYCTTGCASPTETRRVADEILAALEQRAGR